MADKADNQARWYVAHTYSGYENKVCQDLRTMVENRGLQDLICDAQVPTETVLERKTVTEKQRDEKGKLIRDEEGKTVTTTKEVDVEVQRKLYPGYVFVKMVMNDDTWYIVRNTRGCTGFVGPGSKPEPLSEAEVRQMRIEDFAAAPAAKRAKPNFQVGDYVSVVTGPFEGFVGLVDEIGEATVKIRITMLGRETPAELPLDQVKALE